MGAVVGVGASLSSVYIVPLIGIISLWFLVPLIAFFLAYFVNNFLQKHQDRLAALEKAKGLTYLLIGAGFLEAFAAGMNNVANAVGPIVGVGLFTEGEGKWIGGFFIALGVILLGKKSS
ncbi:hypothetical protein LC087_05410 [Bacillus carboniphilus]|uniref:Uncharacterized protein n=1 Tax=Bacillus carboniphilus TaxID=86663 RepID=A0ABY9JYI0_9BACI|nr:hypothetical protein [Bacillus carboniphilus]WLR43592.1 hypothetical protein LC087_05410 [Bacillus carboniphilus]